MAIFFPNTTSEVRTLTNLPLINSFTTSFWFQKNASLGDWQYLTLQSEGDGSGEYNGLAWSPAENFGLWNSAGNASAFSVNPNLNEWLYAATTIDAGGTYSGYYWDLDGNVQITSRTETINWQIGISTWGNDTYDEGSETRIAHIKMWDTALTQAELEAERETILAQRNANLIGLWPCFAGATERLRDYSGQNVSLDVLGTISDVDGPPVPWGGKPIIIGRVVAAGQNVTVNQATETDLAQAVTHTRLADVAQATETDTGQAVTPARLKDIAQATETDLAQIIDPARLAAVVQAIEIDTALVVAVPAAIGQATETDLAQLISPARLEAVVQAIETDTAQAITPAELNDVVQAAETDTAQPVTISKELLVNQTGEADLAQPIISPTSIIVVQAGETDLAQPIAGGRGIDVGQSAETDAALSVAGAKIVQLVQAVETDQGRPIGLVTVPSVTELDAWTTVSTVDTVPGSFTVSAGTNRLLVIDAYIRRGVGVDLTGVDYGGEALTQIQTLSTTTGGDLNHTTWYLNDAGIVAATDTNFALTFSGASDGSQFRMHAASYRNVDQTNPVIDSFAASAANDATPTASALNTTENGLVLAAMATNVGSDETPDPTVTWSNMTERLNELATNTLGSIADAPTDGTDFTPSPTNTDSGTSILIAFTLTTQQILGIAAEINESSPVTAVRVVPVGQSLELDTAIAVDAVDTKAVGVAAELDSPFPIRVLRQIAVGQAIEFCDVFPIAIRQPIEVPVQRALETDQGLPIVVAGGAAPPIRDDGAGAGAPGLDLPQMVAAKIRQSQQALDRDDEELLTAIIPVIADSMLRSDQ